ncbi:hypothetical protein LX90_004761 [Lentzea flava]|nr:hypothetical protein [Lentzea flava]
MLALTGRNRFHLHGPGPTCADVGGVAATRAAATPSGHAPAPLLMALIMPCWVIARLRRSISPNPYWPV